MINHGKVADYSWSQSFIPSIVGSINSLAPSVGNEFVITPQTCRFFNADFKLELSFFLRQHQSIYLVYKCKQRIVHIKRVMFQEIWNIALLSEVQLTETEEAFTMTKWKIRMLMCAIKPTLVLCILSVITSELLFCRVAFSSSFTFLLFLHLPSVLQFPLQIFFSPLARAWRRFRNLIFQAEKSAWMLPLRLFTTLQSPSPLVMIRFPLSIHSHLSTFLPT